MSDDQTVWSKTLMDGFTSGMKKEPSDAWIKEQAAELAGRGMSVDYLSKMLRKEVSDVAADRFLNAMGGEAHNATKSEKKSFLGKLFS